MKRIARKSLFVGLAVVVLSALLWSLWEWKAAPTRIALLNFQNFQISKMLKSAENRFVRVEALGTDEIGKLDRYDAVLVFSMGLRVDAGQRAKMQEVAESGVPFYSYAVTSPENDVSNLDSLQKACMESYLGNGGSRNYRSLFNYVRRELCGKKWFTGEVEPVREINPDCLFHLGDENSFNTVDEYESYLKEKGLYREGQRKVAVLTGIAGPFNTDTEHLDSLITAFQNRGFRVYPVASFAKRLDFLQQIRPDAVIYMPHGRLLMGEGDRAVDWLKQNNIPLFCPLTLNSTYSRWMADKQGMSGGFLSQSMVMPELDGGILPYALIAQYEDKDGIYLFKTLPGRLDVFCRTVGNYLELKEKDNSQKRIAVYYFKGPGSASLNAAGLEVLPSLYNFLLALRTAGYDLGDLPSTPEEFGKKIMEQGPVFNDYAEGSMDRYLSSSYPQWVSAKDLDGWLKEELSQETYAGLLEKYGPVPGIHMARQGKDGGQIAVSRVRFGNVVLLPQPMQGTGGNSFQMVHGSNPVPPYPYLASYFWVRRGFGADAMVHFGTHGSLEFIPGKQVALSSDDWSDILVGDVPHFYLYTIANVGEGMIAKRRSYAVTVSYLNPPFMESGMQEALSGLQSSLRSYLAAEAEGKETESENLKIKKMTVAMGLHRDLEMDSSLSRPYTVDQIREIDAFATELVQERIGSGLYVLGEAFSPDRILSSVRLMCKDPLAFALADYDVARGRVSRERLQDRSFFASVYYAKAEPLIDYLLENPRVEAAALLERSGIEPQDRLAVEKSSASFSGRKSADYLKANASGAGMAGKEQVGKGSDAVSGASGQVPARSGKDKGFSLSASGRAERLRAVESVLAALESVKICRKALEESPRLEIASLINALSGGYVAPSSGGDFIANPAALPTGRNLYAVNAEATPSRTAWEKGKKMAREMLDDYVGKHGNMPAKVSFTLWSGSFIESEGATLAQIFYLLGVEPVWDRFGRVLDVRLIPSQELGRARIDVVVQTSGQFRDLAASRLELLQRAIVMAAESVDRGTVNHVAEGRLAAEKVLLEKGYSPKQARELAVVRIFGGINGAVGTGITGMVMAGDRWEKETEIAETYLHNMGAMYASSQDWGEFREGLFEAALQNTDVVVQPRQSNTWGALSLDHVYEFMGGLTLTVRNVTGKDPDNYFNDLRNRYQARVQDLRAAIGVESRTVFFNPRYIREQMKGGAGSASVLAERVHNTYGWNVMKPSVIDNRMWDQIYETYVEDIHKLGVREFFEAENPAALQEMTGVMLESSRKGYWKASEKQLSELARLHAELVEKYGACCNGFTCGNALLRDFVSRNLPEAEQTAYREEVGRALQAVPSDGKGKNVVLEKESPRDRMQTREMGSAKMILLVFAVLAAGASVAAFILIGKRRKKNE